MESKEFGGVYICQLEIRGPEGIFTSFSPNRVNETSGLDDRVEHAPQFKNLEFLFPETTRNFSNLPLQYKGFCGFCIATQDRLLVPGVCFNRQLVAS